MTAKSRLDIAIQMINSILAVIAAVMIIFMMLSICYAVFARFLWNVSVPWTVEVSSYLMLYITFLCIAWLQAKNGHVQVDLFTSKLGTRARAIVDAFTSLGAAVIGFILAWKGTLVTIDYYRRDVTVMGILNTPQFVLMAVMPVGGALLLAVCMLRVYRSIMVAVPATPSREDDEMQDRLNQ